MAKVSFYLFEKSPERQVDSTCRLCRKILRKPAKIWLYSPNTELQTILDDLVWSFDPESFLAHGIDDTTAPICISAQLPVEPNWIVFNFHDKALEPQAGIDHIIEIIENNEPAKQVGREKFKDYRQMGIAPQTHKL